MTRFSTLDFRLKLSSTVFKEWLKTFSGNSERKWTSHKPFAEAVLEPVAPFPMYNLFRVLWTWHWTSVHLLSPQHQERARPNIQKALLALQNNLKLKPEFEQSNPSQTTQGTMSTNSEAASATPTSKPEPSFTAVENSILEMLFSLNSEPPAELIDAAAGETGIDSAKIRLWLEMKKKSQKQGNDEKSDQSDSFSKDNDFSDDESNGDKLKIDESATSEKAELKNPEPEVKQPKKETENDQSNRRMRTLISPDQAEVLYREYLEVNSELLFSCSIHFSQDNCPPRQRLEEIAAQTGLKRRVVQVWFQNTRARERKGQYRSVSMFAQKQAQQTTNTAQTTKNAQLSIKPKFPVSPASLLSLTDTLKHKSTTLYRWFFSLFSKNKFVPKTQNIKVSKRYRKFLKRFESFRFIAGTVEYGKFGIWIRSHFRILPEFFDDLHFDSELFELYNTCIFSFRIFRLFLCQISLYFQLVFLNCSITNSLRNYKNSKTSKSHDFEPKLRFNSEIFWRTIFRLLNFRQAILDSKIFESELRFLKNSDFYESEFSYPSVL